MLEQRGFGIGLVLTLVVLAVLIGLCGLLLIPHLVGRGLVRMARFGHRRLLRRRRALPASRLLGSLKG